MRTGAAGVIVASDPHSEVSACHWRPRSPTPVPRMQHLDETGVYVQLIASVPVHTGGDVAKAIVCGADAVLVEAPDASGVPGDGLRKTVIGDLRRTMATCGFESVKELQSAELVVIS